MPVAAYYVLKWYAYDNWIVTAQGEQIVVKQGQPGGVLWFHPRVVDHTGVTTSDVSPAAIGPLKAGVQRPSLHAAKAYVSTITTTTTTTTTTSPRRPRRCRARIVTTPLATDHHDHDSGAVTTTTTAPVTATTAAP